MTQHHGKIPQHRIVDEALPFTFKCVEFDMGNVLFIRVSAQTYSETAMRKAWPGLCRLALPGDEYSVAPAAREKGVLDLVTALTEGVHFSVFPKEVLPILAPHARELEQLQGQLETALGDHDVPQAKQQANAIERALDKAENALP